MGFHPFFFIIVHRVPTNTDMLVLTGLYLQTSTDSMYICVILSLYSRTANIVLLGYHCQSITLRLNCHASSCRLVLLD